MTLLESVARVLTRTYPVPVASFLFAAIAFGILFHELRKRR